MKAKGIELQKRIKEIKDLVHDGLTVQTFTLYHYRVNKAVDVFPVSARLHFLKTREWTTYTPTDLYLKLREAGVK